MQPLAPIEEASPSTEAAAPPLTDDVHPPSPSLAVPTPNDRPISEAPSSIYDPRAPSLPVPNPPFMLQQRDSLASSFDSIPAGSTTNNFIHPSSSLTPLDPSKLDVPYPHYDPDPNPEDFPTEKPTRPWYTRPRWSCLILLALLLTITIVLGAYFGSKKLKPKHAASGASKPSPASPSSPASPNTPTVVFGGDGTVVTTDQGTTFTYNNSFGGYFVTDSGNPFNNAARAQSWSPALNETWTWGKDRVLGCVPSLIISILLGVGRPAR